jgi:hypothetical protein
LSDHLFDLSEYRGAFGIFFRGAVNALMRAKDPVLRQIKVETKEHLPTYRVTATTGETVEFETIKSEMRFTLHLPDIVNSNFEALVLNLDDAADQGLKNLMPQVFAYLSRVCAATGNVVDGQGQPFSFDLVLDVLDKIQIDFDEAGNPEMPTMVLSPDLFEKIKMRPPTQEQVKRRDEIIKRKREEFDAQRRTRKIP